jgi:hypothetical protein
MLRVMGGIILGLIGVCLYLQYSLSSARDDLVSSKATLNIIEQVLQQCQESSQKAEFLRRKHEEIIAELFLDQDTTLTKFDDLEAKFQALRGSRGCPKGAVSEKINSDGVDLSGHKRLLSEAACLAGTAGACSSPTISAE